MKTKRNSKTRCKNYNNALHTLAHRWARARSDGEATALAVSAQCRDTIYEIDLTVRQTDDLLTANRALYTHAIASARWTHRDPQTLEIVTLTTFWEKYGPDAQPLSRHEWPETNTPAL